MSKVYQATKYEIPKKLKTAYKDDIPRRATMRDLTLSVWMSHMVSKKPNVLVEVTYHTRSQVILMDFTVSMWLLHIKPNTPLIFRGCERFLGSKGSLIMKTSLTRHFRKGNVKGIYS